MTTTRHRGRVVASVAALVGLVVGGALAAPSVAGTPASSRSPG
ncbi:hypothetical protein [Curtobacterium sp. Leaf261]|nr:hypothetical protein [Curtobacterium sp. Leaf261]